MDEESWLGVGCGRPHAADTEKDAGAIREKRNTTIAPAARELVGSEKEREELGDRTSSFSVFLTRGTPLAGQESRRGSESAEPGRSAGRGRKFT
jgi:hypothetical protein